MQRSKGGDPSSLCNTAATAAQCCNKYCCKLLN